MSVPAVPGAINLVPPLVGNEIVNLVNNGPQAAQTTTAAIAALAIANLLVPIVPGVAPLTYTGNTTSGAPPLLPTLGTMLNLVGQNNLNAAITLNSFNKLPQINGQRANGTFAAPTQVIAGNVLMRIGGWGYAAAGDGNPAQWIPGHTGLIEVQSSEAWVGNHNGTQISVWTTPNGTLAPIQIAAFTNAGSFVLGGAQTTPTPPGNSPANNVTSAFGVDDQTTLGVNTTGAYSKAGTQVVGARATGWTAMTGTPDIVTSYATSSVTLAQLAGRVMAIQAAMTTHGLIGP